MVDTNGTAGSGAPRPGQDPNTGPRYDRPIFGTDTGKGPAPRRRQSEQRRAERRPASVSSTTVPSGGATRHASAGGKTPIEGGKAPITVPKGRRRLGLQAQFMVFSLVALVIIGTVAWFYLRPVESVFVLDSYQYATVQQRDFRDLIIGTGSVEPETVMIFAAPIDTKVDAIYVQVGEDVVRGAPLLQLVSEKLLEDVDSARSSWEEAVLDLEQAQLKTAGDLLAKEREVEDAERVLATARERLPLTEELFKLGGVSESEMQDALAEVEQLQLQVDNAMQARTLAERQAELTLRQADQKARTAERTLTKLQEQLDEMTVRARVDGRVLSLSVRAGQHVASGTELLRHADITRQNVATAVTPEQASRLQTGTPALLRVGVRTMPAVVSFIAPLAAQTQGERAAVPVTLTLDPEVAATLRPYTETSVELELGVREQRPALPRGPFFASGDASFVYVVSEDGTQAERRDVRYSAIDGNFVEIIAGLEPGDRIVYSSYTAFRIHPTVELIREGGRPVD